MQSSSADGLVRFLTSTPEYGGDGVLLERLGQVLADAGQDGLTLAETMRRTGVSRPQFLDALSRATGSGLVERHGVDDSLVRLSPGAKSLFAA